MTPDRREELEEMRRDGQSAARRDSFRASARIAAEWDRAHPVGIAEILDWIDELRAVFGEPAVDPRPWCGDDFRL